MSSFSSAYASIYAQGDRFTYQIPNIRLGGETITLPKDYTSNYPIWRLLRDCYNGEVAIKQGRERYLRKLSNQSKEEEYDAYLARAYFYNAVRRTHTGLIGSVMRKNPEITLPKGYNPDLSSITQDGLNLNQFIQLVASEVILTGRYGILASNPVETRLGDLPTPYLSGYQAEAIPFYRTRLWYGKKIVDRIALLEDESTNGDISTELEPIIRLLCLDPDPATGKLVYSQRIYRDDDPSKPNGSQSMEEVSITVQGRKLDYIPFQFVNTNNLLPGITPSPLLDIATLNLSHYESTALLEHGRFYAGMPTYYIAGEDNDPMAGLAEGLGTATPMNVGPSNVWMLGPNDKCGLLEFNGHGLIFLENAVESKQVQMQSMGGRLIAAPKKAAALSSEAYTLLETGDEATLMDVSTQVGLAISKSLDSMSDLANALNTTGSLVELNKEFVRSDLTAREVRSLQSLYERRLIPLDVLYYTLRQIGVVPMEYSLEDFKALLETPSQMYQEPSITPVPGGPTLMPVNPRNPPAPPKDPNKGNAGA